MLSRTSIVKKQLFSINHRALYHYQPLIKFSFSNSDSLEIIDSSASKSMTHPCSGSENLYPNSSECISPKKWFENFKPLVIKKYTNVKKQEPVKPNKSSKSTAADNTKYIVDSNKFDRDLKENELSSLSQLPKQFQYKPLDDKEMELINGGGIMI